MTSDRERGRFEIVTAVMLGLVSLVTAAAALQASFWNAEAGELGDDSGDARDVSVSQAVLADYSRRGDAESSLQAQRWEYLRQQATDPLEELRYQTRIDIELAKATPGLAEAWTAWAGSGFSADADPLTDPVYLVERDGDTLSYAYASRVAGELSSSISARSGILAQSALIQALALFLFGISGVNRLARVREAVLTLGVGAFVAGVALAVTAF